MAVTVAPAAAEDLDEVLELFAGYQRFYTGRDAGDEQNRRFLERFVAPGEAGLLLVARDDAGAAVGFANLYWTFSSTEAREQVHLNDLFTAEVGRGRGVGRALIDACAAVARDRGCATLTWMTAVDNRVAQRLYESTGAERSIWFEYELEVAGR